MPGSSGWLQHAAAGPGLVASRAGPTAFTAFKLRCPPAPTGELNAIFQAQDEMIQALPMIEKAGADEAALLAKRAQAKLDKVHGLFSYICYRQYSDLPRDIHDARMDLEQAAQNAHSEAPGSKGGDHLACAVDDLLPYDPLPNVHPMDRRISLAPLPLVAPGNTLPRAVRGGCHRSRHAGAWPASHGVAFL
mmetsp:Transcript_15039/g.35235  ORF Transcript_15039/g.35235 Transcript_15039/m.35235 type:complete len:191 (+) Transcript_15039:68-640(+)